MLKYFITILVFTITNSSIAQFETLKFELFENQQKVILKVDTSNIYNKESFDFTLLEDSIKYIVDSKRVKKILDSIAFHSPLNLLDDLHKIYLDQFDNYYNDWGVLFKKGRYSNIAYNDYGQHMLQYDFENTLKAISLREVSADSVWSVIQTDYKRLRSSFGGSYKYVDSVFFYSKKMKELYRNAFFLGFDYVNPFVPKLKNHYIKELAKCSCPNQDSNCDYNMLFYLKEMFTKIQDDEIVVALLNKKHCLVESPALMWHAALYLNNHHDPELLSVTLHELFKKDDWNYHLYLDYIYSNMANQKIFHEILSKYIIQGNTLALYDTYKYPSWRTLNALRLLHWKTKLQGKHIRYLKQKIKSIKYRLIRKRRYAYQVKRML